MIENRPRILDYIIKDSSHIPIKKMKFKVNLEPEWNVELSIPIETHDRYFSNFWVCKRSDLSEQNLVT